MQNGLFTISKLGFVFDPRTVGHDIDWRFDNLCGIHLQS